MSLPLPDGSRDPRVEDPTNAWLIHPAARSLLRWCIARGVTANQVSIAGLCLGVVAAGSFGQWRTPAGPLVGLCFAIGWMIADGLDGMIARATGTSSPFGRLLDGLCDHGVFILIYCALAGSIGTAGAWALAVAAGALHALQSNLYEGERARYHRRVGRGRAAVAGAKDGSGVLRAYDRLVGAVGRWAQPFDLFMEAHRSPGLAQAYGDAAARPMRSMILLTANTRVWLIVAACLVGDPRLFWWAEIGPLSLVALIGLAWHRSVERRLIRRALPPGETDIILVKGHQQT